MGRGLNERRPTDVQLRIYSCVTSQPGIRFSELMADLELKNGTAQYNIDELLRRGLLRKERDENGRNPRFYVQGDIGPVLEYTGDGRKHGRSRLGPVPSVKPPRTDGS